MTFYDNNGAYSNDDGGINLHLEQVQAFQDWTHKYFYKWRKDMDSL